MSRKKERIGIPSHYFEKGEYEVWATKSYNGGAPMEKISGNLQLKTAQCFNWPNMEIRLHGVPVNG